MRLEKLADARLGRNWASLSFALSRFLTCRDEVALLPGGPLWDRTCVPPAVRGTACYELMSEPVPRKGTASFHVWPWVNDWLMQACNGQVLLPSNVGQLLRAISPSELPWGRPRTLSKISAWSCSSLPHRYGSGEHLQISCLRTCLLGNLP